MGRTEIFEALTLVVVVAVVQYLETTRTGFPIDKRRDLGLNLLALAVVIIGGELAKSMVLYGFDFIHLRSALSPSLLTAIPSVPKILLAILLGDFSLYWVHRAMHRRLLWPTHAFHHSIPEIWWLSGALTSLTHLFLFAVPQVLIGYYLLQLSVTEAALAFSFGVVVNVWIHANIWVDLGPLEWLLITPNYHRIHHGAKGYTSKNLAFVFTVWDRMFGTYIDPKVTGRNFTVLAVPTRRLFRMIIGY